MSTFWKAHYAWYILFPFSSNTDREHSQFYCEMMVLKEEFTSENSGVKIELQYAFHLFEIKGT